ncbi:MAG: D-aminoacyl-tRNA deacylase [Pirellulales bacterium]
MRVVLQRVSEAHVSIDREIVGQIGRGLLVFVGVEEGDTVADAEWLAAKIIGMRIFPDDTGKMNESVVAIDGDILAISQFTLHASTHKGNRPSFIRAARPEAAVPLYESFLEVLERGLGRHVPRGVFAADMQVSLTNDGPVTIIVDSRQQK